MSLKKYVVNIGGRGCSLSSPFSRKKKINFLSPAPLCSLRLQKRFLPFPFDISIPSRYYYSIFDRIFHVLYLHIPLPSSPSLSLLSSLFSLPSLLNLCHYVMSLCHTNMLIYSQSKYDYHWIIYM